MSDGNSVDPRPLVALVGRPNVGKSTLFNRLVGRKDAIVQDEPGVTRDRRYGEADWDGYAFRVVDTGGIALGRNQKRPQGMAAHIIDQAMKAAEDADLVLFIVDVKEGLTGPDHEAADLLRRTGKPIIWVANKCDNAGEEAAAQELFELGGQVCAISAQHGRATGDLCDAIIAALPGAPRLNDLEEPDESDAPIRLALVGRPNAGKSSLTNRLLGEERMLVDAVPGTTRDALDTPVEIAGRKYVLVDTAGIRRRSKIPDGTEKVSVIMAEKAIERADVCAVVVDAAEGLAEQEAKIAGLCEEHGKALVICFNKIDLLDGEGAAKREEQLREDLARQLQFVPWARVVFTSALTGKGMTRLLDAVQAAHRSYTTRVTTGQLNRWFERIVTAHPPSLFHGKPVKLYFIQQPQAKPPTFILSVNHPEGVHFSYRRYLVNQLREAFDLDGTPVRIVCRARKSSQSRQRPVKEMLPSRQRPRSRKK